MRSRHCYWLWLSLALLLAGCAVNPVTGRNELALMNVSVAQEVEMGGKSFDQALQRMGGLYPDPVLNDYVNQVGQRLARTSHRPELHYRFRVVNDSSPNAFALPGGYIAVTRGLLINMENEAQLAAVLGHEIGHVTARHSVQELQRSMLLGTTVGLIGTLAGGTGYEQLLTQVGSLTADLLGKSYSRDQEYEADRLGIEYLARSDYAVQGAVQLQTLFMQKLDTSSNNDWLSGLFRTHPFSRDRLEANRQLIARNYVEFRSQDGLDRDRYSRHTFSLRETREAYRLYDQARSAEAAGNLAGAIETYHKAMQLAPEHGLLLTGLGMAYLRNEDMVPARRYLLKAISVDPDFYQSRMGLGYIYLQNKQAGDAAAHLEASIKLLPTVEGTFLLAEAEEARANPVRARQLYQLVVEADANGRLGQAAATRLKGLAQ